MKKNLFLIAFLLSFIISHSQDSLLHKAFPMIEGKVTYNAIINLDSLPKDKIFLKIKEWAVDNYTSSKATLETEDKEAGYIVYKGYLNTQLIYESKVLFKGKPYNVHIYHTLKFYIKEGKIKMVFTDLETVIYDAMSAFLDEHPRRPIELFGDYTNKLTNKKKKEKEIELVQRQAAEINKQLLDFMNKMQKDISQKKSGFDF